MGNLSILPTTMSPQWKIPAALMVTAALSIPLWQALVSTPTTGALSSGSALLDFTSADTLIVYAAPANADPVLRISSRDTDGNWQESEVQLSNDNPHRSAKLVEAAVAREAHGIINN